jgi:hypothetical protein
VEIIVKLGQKCSGTYGCIAISKDIVILSIVMRRFYCIIVVWQLNRVLREEKKRMQGVFMLAADQK